jgi:hypothetical protein
MGEDIALDLCRISTYPWTTSSTVVVLDTDPSQVML